MEEPGIFKQTYPDYALFNRSTYFRIHHSDCFNSAACTEKLPPHHFCLVHTVGKTANINGKKLLS
jgi:hypothetical protein